MLIYIAFCHINFMAWTIFEKQSPPKLIMLILYVYLHSNVNIYIGRIEDKQVAQHQPADLLI